METLTNIFTTIMETLTNIFTTIGKLELKDLIDILNYVDANIAWGPYMLALIGFTGLYLIIGLKFMPIIKIPYALKLLKTKTDDTEKGEISPRSALFTAMSATVGVGNIAGVATAIFWGGPGAIFWMWMMGFIGMATKFGEAVLAVKYREIDSSGSFVGGPMYYIKNGLGKNWKWLGFIFALFGTVAAFGIGNMVQSNTVAIQLQDALNIQPLITGFVLAIISGVVIIGGVKRIGLFASSLVPLMSSIYLISAVIIVFMNISMVPAVFNTIMENAFDTTSVAGGFAGSAMALAMQYGISRGVFSNEAGLGSAPIAHAAAKTNSPVKQGTIAMLGTFFDTIIICSLTALVILISGAGGQGVDMTSAAFTFGLPEYGKSIVTISIVLFAFTTILGWSYYGERCSVYVFGQKSIEPYRFLWIAFIIIGALASSNVKLVWTVASVMNGFMAIPNLIALVLLSPVIFKLSKEYFSRK